MKTTVTAAAPAVVRSDKKVARINRWPWVAIVGLSFGLAMGCTKEEEEAAERAVRTAKEVKKEAEGPLSWLVNQAEREQKEKDDQLAHLQKTVDEIERLLREGKLDEAEVKAVKIAWKPIVGPENSNDKLLIAQFDEKRRSFMKIIESRRKGR